MGFVHIKPAGHETVSMPEFHRGVLGIMVKEPERDASVDWSTTFGGSAEEQDWFEHWVIQLWSATKSESQQRPCWYFDFCWDRLTPQSICLFQESWCRISTRRVIEFKCWPSSATVDKRIHPTGPNRPYDHTGYPPLKAWNIHHLDSLTSMVFPCLSSEFDVLSENTSFRGDFPQNFSPFSHQGRASMIIPLWLASSFCWFSYVWLRQLGASWHRGMPKDLDLGPSWWVYHPQVRYFWRLVAVVISFIHVLGI